MHDDSSCIPGIVRIWWKACEKPSKTIFWCIYSGKILKSHFKMIGNVCKIMIFNDFDEKQQNQELSTQNSKLWRVSIDLVINVWKNYQQFKDLLLFQLMLEPNTKISSVQSTLISLQDDAFEKFKYKFQ